MKSGKPLLLHLLLPHHSPHLSCLLLACLCLAIAEPDNREVAANNLTNPAAAESARMGAPVWRMDPALAESLGDKASCSLCHGRSLCLPSSSQPPRCFCPPDYAGQFCEEDLVKLPAVCTRDQCENGGVCEQGKNSTLCVCPPNYVGANCSRVVVWIQVAMNLYENGSPVRQEEVNQTEPFITYAACDKLIITMLRGPNAAIANSLIGCELQHFEKVQLQNLQGIRVITLLKFDPGYNISLLSAYEVRRHLQIAPDLPDVVGVDMEYDETVTVTNYDLCKEEKHDCSPSATCVFDGSTYLCECNRFYSDGGIPGLLLPGRDCYYSFLSGFFLGCLVILPILIVTITALFYCRRYEAQKAWVNTPNNPDTIQLVSSEYPKYGA